MPVSLQNIDTSAWKELETAAGDPGSGFRFINLCSVDAQGKPQARMVVLRRVDKLARVIEFHTDIRSPKWQEITANPNLTALGYCHQTRLQLRLQGSAELYAAESEVAEKAWSLLSPQTRSTYIGGPPGDEQSFDIDDKKTILESGEAANGKRHFGVIVLRVSQLDWYQLQKGNNQRALLTYSSSGDCLSAQWINP